MAELEKWSGIVTTSLKASREQLQVAFQISKETGLPLVLRGKKTMEELYDEWNVSNIIVVKSQKVSCFVGDSEFFAHPCMASLRIKDIKKGKNDTMIKAMDLRPGQKLLDCTLGLGSDAIVASYVIGGEGLVLGLESSPIIAATVRAGMSNYQKASRDLQEAMKRIVIKNVDHREVLANLPENCFDVVYFDPMFRRPMTKSNNINAFRPLADYRSLNPEIIDMALRVAARRVVVKENKHANKLKELGFDYFMGGRSAPVIYGVICK